MIWPRAEAKTNSLRKIIKISAKSTKPKYGRLSSTTRSSFGKKRGKVGTTKREKTKMTNDYHILYILSSPIIISIWE